MLRKIKTALLGDQSRRTGGSLSTRDAAPDPVASGEPSDPSSVGETDPFRPSFDHTDSRLTDDVSMDRIFDVLGNERRRYALAYLSTDPGVVTTDELAGRVAAWECEKQPSDVGSEERDRVHVSLRHSHLPMLADVSAISYDADEGTLERGDRFDRFAHYLRGDE